MKLSLIFIFLFIFPYINLKILTLIFLSLFKKSISKNMMFIITKIINKNIIYFLVFIILCILSNNNAHSEIQNLRQNLSIISSLSFKFAQHRNKYFCQINIYYLTYSIFSYIIKIFYINFTHLLIINNLHLFIQSETLLSKIMASLNLVYFDRKYCVNLYRLTMIGNTGILEVIIENIKNFNVGMKCKCYTSKITFISYYQYCIKNFCIQIFENRIKFSITIWYKLFKNKI